MSGSSSGGAVTVPPGRPTSRKGMGAVPFPGGTGFRVWAPNADSVAVSGDFNQWSRTSHPLASEGNGYWSGEAAGAQFGHRYQFVIMNNGREIEARDPYARDVEQSDKSPLIVDSTSFDWQGDSFNMPPWNELVIYELHIGTFNDDPGGPPGTLRTAIEKLDHLVETGVNAISVMPPTEFIGGFSWGYNTAFPFAIESDYGGVDDLKTFIKAAHEHGLAVIIDVVYNHFGPQDLPTWRFDGWYQGEGGGIYFYNDWKRKTPWGDTRPDYGRGEVRQFLRDNALYWLGECRADGLRWDMTLYIRTVDANPADAGQVLDDGWEVMRWINREIDERWPWKIIIAEDLRDEPAMTRKEGNRAAGFDSQWGANFVHPVRRAVQVVRDEDRSMREMRDAILSGYAEDVFRRVVYTESHDEVANGRARVPQDISPNDPGGWFARKRSTLGAALVLTAPGIPMLFQGQEFLEDEWFRDADPIDWGKKTRFAGIYQMYKDLIRLRRNRNNRSRGLTGHHTNVFHLNDQDKLIAFHRWDGGGPRDDVVIVANFANRSYDSYRIGFPRVGRWDVVFNSDWSGYSPDFGNHPGYDTDAWSEGRDGLEFQGNVGIGPYSVLILIQNS